MNKEAIDLIEKIKDQASRATMVQDRSVGIIKQTCGVISKECDQALAILTEQPPAGDVFEIRIPNLKPDEVEIVRIEINAFTKQLLNNLQARRRTN